ncbi:microtubule-associated protein futsch-like [Onthophagus taurus]|uniref:microtubule-associated protein futsch-like n=1 Tax=Onthophagus taurus TaxID=166361 RepID=UPI0039BEC293
MVVYRIYYVMVDKPSKDVNIVWKVLHLVIQILAAISGIVNAAQFYVVLLGYHHKCPLYANLYFFRIHEKHYDVNHVLPHNVCISLSETKWGKDSYCEYTFSVWLISFISGFILAVFFYWSRSGGAGEESDSFVQPWKHVFPTFIVSIIMTIVITTAALLQLDGLTVFCNQFEPYLHTKKCNQDMNAFSVPWTKKTVNIYLAIVILRISIPLCVFAWVAHTAVLLLRMCISPDFYVQIIKITGISKTVREKHVSGGDYFPKPHAGIHGSVQSLHNLYFERHPHSPHVKFAEEIPRKRRKYESSINDDDDQNSSDHNIYEFKPVLPEFLSASNLDLDDNLRYLFDEKSGANLDVDNQSELSGPSGYSIKEKFGYFSVGKVDTDEYKIDEKKIIPPKVAVDKLLGAAGGVKEIPLDVIKQLIQNNQMGISKGNEDINFKSPSEQIPGSNEYADDENRIFNEMGQDSFFTRNISDWHEKSPQESLKKSDLESPKTLGLTHHSAGTPTQVDPTQRNQIDNEYADDEDRIFNEMGQDSFFTRNISDWYEKSPLEESQKKSDLESPNTLGLIHHSTGTPAQVEPTQRHQNVGNEYANDEDKIFNEMGQDSFFTRNISDLYEKSPLEESLKKSDLESPKPLGVAHHSTGTPAQVEPIQRNQIASTSSEKNISSSSTSVLISTTEKRSLHTVARILSDMDRDPFFAEKVSEWYNRIKPIDARGIDSLNESRFKGILPRKLSPIKEEQLEELPIKSPKPHLQENLGQKSMLSTFSDQDEAEQKVSTIFSEMRHDPFFSEKMSEWYGELPSDNVSQKLPSIKEEKIEEIPTKSSDIEKHDLQTPKLENLSTTTSKLNEVPTVISFEQKSELQIPKQQEIPTSLVALEEPPMSEELPIKSIDLQQPGLQIPMPEPLPKKSSKKQKNEGKTPKLKKIPTKSFIGRKHDSQTPIDEELPTKSSEEQKQDLQSPKHEELPSKIADIQKHDIESIKLEESPTKPSGTQKQDLKTANLEEFPTKSPDIQKLGALSTKPENLPIKTSGIQEGDLKSPKLEEVPTKSFDMKKQDLQTTKLQALPTNIPDIQKDDLKSTKLEQSPTKSSDIEKHDLEPSKHEEYPTTRSDTQKHDLPSTKLEDLPTKTSDTQKQHLQTPKHEELPSKIADTQKHDTESTKLEESPTIPSGTQKQDLKTAKLEDFPTRSADIQKLGSLSIKPEDLPIKPSGIQDGDLKYPKLEEAPTKNSDMEKQDLQSPKLQALPTNIPDIQKDDLKSTKLEQSPTKSSDLEKHDLEPSKLEEYPTTRSDTQKHDLPSTNLEDFPTKTSDIQEGDLKSPKLEEAPTKNSDMEKQDLQSPKLQALPTNIPDTQKDDLKSTKLEQSPTKSSDLEKHDLEPSKVEEYPTTRSDTQKHDLPSTKLEDFPTKTSDIQEGDLKSPKVEDSPTRISEMEKQDLQSPKLQALPTNILDIQRDDLKSTKPTESSDIEKLDLEPSKLEEYPTTRSDTQKHDLPSTKLEDFPTKTSDIQEGDLKSPKVEELPTRISEMEKDDLQASKLEASPTNVFDTQKDDLESTKLEQLPTKTSDIQKHDLELPKLEEYPTTRSDTQKHDLPSTKLEDFPTKTSDIQEDDLKSPKVEELPIRISEMEKDDLQASKLEASPTNVFDTQKDDLESTKLEQLPTKTSDIQKHDLEPPKLEEYPTSPSDIQKHDLPRTNLEDFPTKTSDIQERGSQYPKLEESAANISSMEKDDLQTAKFQALPTNISDIQKDDVEITKLEQLPTKTSDIQERDSQSLKLEESATRVSDVEKDDLQPPKLQVLPTNISDIQKRDLQPPKLEQSPTKISDIQEHESESLKREQSPSKISEEMKVIHLNTSLGNVTELPLIVPKLSSEVKPVETAEIQSEPTLDKSKIQIAESPDEVAESSVIATKQHQDTFPEEIETTKIDIDYPFRDLDLPETTSQMLDSFQQTTGYDLKQTSHQSQNEIPKEISVAPLSTTSKLSASKDSVTNLPLRESKLPLGSKLIVSEEQKEIKSEETLLDDSKPLYQKQPSDKIPEVVGASLDNNSENLLKSNIISQGMVQDDSNLPSESVSVKPEEISMKSSNLSLRAVEKNLGTPTLSEPHLKELPETGHFDILSPSTSPLETKRSRSPIENRSQDTPFEVENRSEPHSRFSVENELPTREDHFVHPEIQLSPTQLPPINENTVREDSNTVLNINPFYPSTRSPSILLPPPTVQISQGESLHDFISHRVPPVADVFNPTPPPLFGGRGLLTGTIGQPPRNRHPIPPAQLPPNVRRRNNYGVHFNYRTTVTEANNENDNDDQESRDLNARSSRRGRHNERERRGN